MRICVIVLILATLGCAKSSGGGDVKTTFAAWSEDSSTRSIDLSHGPGTASGTLFQAGAVICTCQFTIAGGIMSGTLDVSSCAGASCSSYEGAFTYSHGVDNDSLEICRTSDSTCVEYH